MVPYQKLPTPRLSELPAELDRQYHYGSNRPMQGDRIEGEDAGAAREIWELLRSPFVMPGRPRRS